jgi:hypothetical protein
VVSNVALTFVLVARLAGLGAVVAACFRLGVVLASLGRAVRLLDLAVLLPNSREPEFDSVGRELIRVFSTRPKRVESTLRSLLSEPRTAESIFADAIVATRGR